MRVSYALLIFAGITMLVLPTAVPLMKSSVEFSMLETKWNGCSKLAHLLNEEGEVEPIMYPYNSVGLENKRGALVVVGPNTGFSSLEAKEVKEFVRDGNTLFIADDFGTANTLLGKMGVEPRFSNKELSDIFYSKRGEFPVVVRSEVGDKDKVTLNIPSTIEGADGKALTSKVSLVGGDRGRGRGRGIGRGRGGGRASYPILAELNYGDGKIVLLSDPSVLVNDMFSTNREFIEDLVASLNSNKFYFDEAHHSSFNPYSISTNYVQKNLDREKAFQVFLAVSALAIFIESGVARIIFESVGRLLPQKEEDIFRDLPQWVDRDKLHRIVEEMRRGSKLG